MSYGTTKIAQISGVSIYAVKQARAEQRLPASLDEHAASRDEVIALALWAELGRLVPGFHRVARAAFEAALVVAASVLNTPSEWFAVVTLNASDETPTVTFAHRDGIAVDLVPELRLIQIISLAGVAFRVRDNFVKFN